MREAKIVKSPSGRIKRASQLTKGPLAVRGKEPGFEYRIVNDIDDRVLDFTEAGYEVVQDKDVSIGDKRVDKPAAEGSVKRFNVGGGQRAVLMRIREDWYKEDQKEKADEIARQELAIKKDALDGNYGKLVIERD
jgi:hypothetical protein